MLNQSNLLIFVLIFKLQLSFAGYKIPLQPSINSRGQITFKLNYESIPFSVPTKLIAPSSQSTPIDGNSNTATDGNVCRFGKWYTLCNPNPTSSEPSNQATTNSDGNQSDESSDSSESAPISSHGYLTPDQVMKLNTQTTDMNGQGFGSRISNEALQQLLNNCQTRDCKKQKSENIICKETLIKMVTEYQNKVQGRDCSKDVRRQFDMIYQYKLALIQKAGLSNAVTPADNGVVDHDIVLTEEQAAFLLEEINNKNPSISSTRKKRSGLFFNSANIIKKWDTSRPIPYNFNANINEKEKQVIRDGIRMIERAGTCIRFRYDPRANGYFIHFVKSEHLTTCGLANMGKIWRGTQVSLTFGNCDDMSGVVAHEILHVLGVSHMHQRLDRDRHLKIEWDRIDPQNYDFFVISDIKTHSSYGVSYDYESIMHYKSSFAPRSFLKNTMIPLRDPQRNIKKMGQRKRLSKSDVELLNKMYCSNTCSDTRVFCGIWANIGLCTSKAHRRFMSKHCKESCNKCNHRG